MNDEDKEMLFVLLILGDRFSGHPIHLEETWQLAGEIANFMEEKKKEVESE